MLGLGALAGLVAHNGLFKYYEWHVHAPGIVMAHASILSLSLIGSIYCGETESITLLQNSLLVGLSYCASLFTSIAVYRLFFHRLTYAGFPGPIPARLSKLWHVWACRTSQNHLVLADLHRKYGDFIRTGRSVIQPYLASTLIEYLGPSEVTVFHPDVFWAVDGPKSECIKSDWYDILHPNLSLVTSRVKSSHQRRRRLWLRGLSARGQYRIS